VIRADFNRQSQSRYVSPTDRAKLALALGLWDEAFAFAEQSRVERRGWVVYVKAEPLWDPVRDDPRYQKLVASMALPSLK
jgi:hypothetical protein